MRSLRERRFKDEFVSILKKKYGYDQVYHLPIPDTYHTNEDGRRFSNKRPFDSHIIIKGQPHAFEFKYILGNSFNVKRWVKDRPHQVFGLWRYMVAGGSSKLAICFDSARSGKKLFRVFDILEVLKVREGAEIEIRTSSLTPNMHETV